MKPDEAYDKLLQLLIECAETNKSDPTALASVVNSLYTLLKIRLPVPFLNMTDISLTDKNDKRNR